MAEDSITVTVPQLRAAGEWAHVAGGPVTLHQGGTDEAPLLVAEQGGATALIGPSGRVVE